ncbi:hypothetical protein GALMADRAFT_76087 [Galerina marginata CBS 339.88]|uniref:Uncharacterized protein n=1 Tax=Galerina marginata (strain CBS 339.88) TaxID=685588 RepID=A0A067SUG8_GALM3|nr:hypothetical protein GALMADRAFT_76087 [Galerina marginata CBS 339.88]
MHFPLVSPPKVNRRRHHRRAIALPSLSVTVTGVKPTKLPTALPTPTIKVSSIKATTKVATTPAAKTTTSAKKTTSTSKTSSSARSSSSAAARATPTPIPAGRPFAGRLEGGGTRDNIFGTSTYGSGYPGVEGRGTSGRGFPFYFWPVAWPAAALGGAAAAGVYLSANDEYGSPSNSSRPGGQLQTVSFTSALDVPTIDSADPTATDPPANTTTTPAAPAGMIFRILSDNTTISDLVPHILSTCGDLLALSASTNTTENYLGFGSPHPEEVVQYYRASSIALSMDGYNNSAVYSPAVDSNGDDAVDTPIPTTADLKLMDCLNTTIGADAPLIDPAHAQAQADGALSMHHVPNLSVAGVVGLLWLLRLMF